MFVVPFLRRDKILQLQTYIFSVFDGTFSRNSNSSKTLFYHYIFIFFKKTKHRYLLASVIAIAETTFLFFFTIKHYLKMRKQLTMIFAFVLGANILTNAQDCTFSCAATQADIEVTFVSISGNPCVFVAEVKEVNPVNIDETSSGAVTRNNVTCTSCPNIPGDGTAVTWVLTSTSGTCTSATHSVELTPIQAIVCGGGAQTCVFPTAVLPVEFISFGGISTENGNKLKWQTASEINNQGFEIERSTNGEYWKMIGFVAGKGNSDEVQEYTFVDDSPLQAKNYYRLRQIDFDGIYEYSEVIEISTPLSHQVALNIFPNPTQGELTINSNLENAQITVFNNLGQVILDQHQVNSFAHQLNLNGQPNGIYFLVIQQGEITYKEKIILK